jgi:uncharacterized protein YllA (UPF0747 family)
MRRLDEYFSKLDPTLAEHLAKRRRKVIYHISALKKKAYAAELRRDADASRRTAALADELFPRNGLQERTLGVISFLNWFGPAFLDDVYTAIDLESRGHRVVFL